MAEISSVRGSTKSVVRADVSGAPETLVNYSADGRRIQPILVEVTYQFGPGQHRGWWVATDVKLFGFRVLKPGPAGQQRLGKKTHETGWVQGRTGDVQTDQDLPEWLDEIVSELRPTGQVAVPGSN